MSRGYITIAVGSEHYYKIAENLALSYRYSRQDENPLPFAVITDRGGEYLREYFDEVIFFDAKKAAGSEDKQGAFNLKLRIYELTPYDETIFLDADSLIFKNPDFLFDWFELNGSAVSVIGIRMKSYEPFIQSKCFFSEKTVHAYKLDEYPSFNGGVYYFRRSPDADKCMDLAADLMNNHYDECGMHRFNGKKGDEPVYALAMAVCGFIPVEDKEGESMIFNNRHITERNMNVLAHKCGIKKFGHDYDPAILHFGTINTYRSYYVNQALDLRAFFDGKKSGANPVLKVGKKLTEPWRMAAPSAKFILAKYKAKNK